MDTELFAEFYTAVHAEMGNGHREPHPWQMRLAERIGTGPRAYDDLTTVVAPTGAGKSIIALMHLFRTATDITAPPRMVVVLPRRGLVDQINAEVSHAVQVIAESSNPLLVQVRQGLESRRVPNLDGSVPEGPPAVVDVMRGGVVGGISSTWADHPHVATVLSATPHMAISTLLSRSFGFAPKRHAPYAGLFAVGTVMVFDEAHIQRQAVRTARSVADLVRQDGDTSSVTSHGLFVVEMTATPSHDMDARNAVTISDDDTDPPLHIARVLTAPKTVEIVVDDGKDVSDTLVSHVLRLREGTTGETFAVVANSVRTALAVTDKLRKQGLNVMPVTGRVRGADRKALLEAYPGVLTRKGNPDVDIVVATQALEVGIDADFCGMVTELASGDALTQRFGRVNRQGKRAISNIVVVVPADIPKYKGVYSSDDLTAALIWLESLDYGRVSPLVIKDNPPPVRKPARAVLERFHRGDALRVLLNSGQPPAVYDDPEFWFSDDLSATPETRIVVRRGSANFALPTRADMLRAFPPQDDECWNLSTWDAEEILKGLHKKELRNDGDTSKSVLAIDVRNDGGDVDEFYQGEGADGKPTFTTVAWSTVVVWTDTSVPLLSGGSTVNGVTVSGVPVKGGSKKAAPIPPSELMDDGKGITTTTVFLNGEVPTPSASDIAAAQVRWGASVDAPYWVAARRAASKGADSGFVHLGARGDDGKPLWAVVVPYSTDDADNPGSGDTSSSVTSAETPVLLTDHRSDVAASCEATAALSGVGQGFIPAVRLAGLHHDDGKAHPGFQKMLKASFASGEAPSDVVAKSPRNAPPTVGGKTVFGLPSGWRHEQLSAAIAAHALRGEPDRALVSVLAGLTHGYGRLTFPHGWETLTGVRDGELGVDADDIFTDGTWEQWVSDLSRSLGPWHLAWLEALVRAADHRVSEQGH